MQVFKTNCTRKGLDQKRTPGPKADGTVFKDADFKTTEMVAFQSFHEHTKQENVRPFSVRAVHDLQPILFLSRGFPGLNGSGESNDVRPTKNREMKNDQKRALYPGMLAMRDSL